jgi:hypothetical protein
MTHTTDRPDAVEVEASLPPVNSRAEIPEFASEEEFVQFWETHSIGPSLIEEGKSDPEVQALAARLRGGKERPSPRQPRQPKASHVTTLRLDADVEKRLKQVAALKQMPYQTLLKQFVSERLYEEEKRMGVL